jgi:hypothetical protein
METSFLVRCTTRSASPKIKRSSYPSLVILFQVWLAGPILAQSAQLEKSNRGSRLEIGGMLAVEMDIAEAEGVPYYLFVSPNTTVLESVTGQFAAYSEAGAGLEGGIYVFDAAAGTLAEYGTGAILADEAVDALVSLFLL